MRAARLGAEWASISTSRVSGESDAYCSVVISDSSARPDVPDTSYAIRSKIDSSGAARGVGGRDQFIEKVGRSGRI